MKKLSVTKLWLGGGGWSIDFTLIEIILEEYQPTKQSQGEKILFKTSNLAEKVGIGPLKMETFAKMLMDNRL